MSRSQLGKILEWSHPLIAKALPVKMGDESVNTMATNHAPLHGINASHLRMFQR